MMGALRSCWRCDATANGWVEQIKPVPPLPAGSGPDRRLVELNTAADGARRAGAVRDHRPAGSKAATSNSGSSASPASTGASGCCHALAGSTARATARVRIRTSPIELVDEGPTVCYLGLVLSAGERCRIAETRSHFAVRTDGVAIYPPSWSRSRVRFATESRRPGPIPQLSPSSRAGGRPRPREPAKSLAVERIRDGAYLIIRTAYDLLQPVNGADCVQRACSSPSATTAALPATTAGHVWFVVYPHGPAHLSIPNFELSWVSEADMHAETIAVDYLPHYRVDAVREQTAGWRITRTIAPPSYALALLPRALSADCFPGI